MTKQETLAFEYFKTFTSFEAKLKGLGYHNQGSSNTVTVDWNRVAKDYKPQLAAVVTEGSKEVKYLLTKPPRKMVMQNSSISFVDLGVENNQERKLLSVLCTVRNNFYHGGKYADGQLVGSERDKKLVEYATSIVKKLKV